LIIPESEKQVEQALKAVEAAASLRRRLLSTGQKRFRLSEAWFFSRLGELLYMKRFFQTALVFAEEAVQIHRALSDEHPDVDQVIRVFADTSGQSHRAASSFFLDKLPTDEVFKNLDWFCKEMATYLHKFSLCCWEMHEYDKGLRAVEEAISIQRSAVAKQRVKQNLTSLADFLATLTLFYRRTGDLEKRGLASEELISIYRDGTDLPTLNPPQLDTLSRLYHMSDDEPQKATIAAELVSLYRDLAADQPDGANPFQAELASWLNNFGWTLQALGRFEEGLVTGQESLQITRALAIGTPEGRTNLAAVLDTIAVCLQQLRRYQGAQEFGHEAVVISREVLEATPSHPDHQKFREGLVETMKNYCRTLESLGRTEELQESRKEIEQASRLLL
jgi:tetratricopeptide (TPR) repeat protein